MLSVHCGIYILIVEDASVLHLQDNMQHENLFLEKLMQVYLQELPLNPYGYECTTEEPQGSKEPPENQGS